jgi:hypothetical protein
MLYSADETAVKLHTDKDGIIWFAAGINPAENTNQTIEAFLLSPVISRLSTNIRILGVPQNAELISRLYIRKRQKELASVYLAGPNVCESLQELADPISTLLRMRDVILPVSCGGWHELTDKEYAIYALLARRCSSDNWFENFAKLFYAPHPLYKVLDFVGGLAHKQTAMLLTTIIDPRWYVDRRRPDNPSKLDLFLGLTPKIQRRVSDNPLTLKRGRDFRCSNVLRCWKTQDPALVDFSAPENFLWRIWRAAGAGAKGDLRASQAFVRYLRLNWLDRLAQKRQLSDGLFLPDRFFKSIEEQEAFAAHLE